MSVQWQCSLAAERRVTILKPGPHVWRYVTSEPIIVHCTGSSRSHGRIG